MRTADDTSDQLRQYILITGNYWAFTLTDGALRMLVVLYFHQLGYTPLSIALLFLFYEAFGVVTNLIGGWVGAHIGLNKMMNLGLFLQILALSLLLVPSSYLTVAWKMSAKSTIKLLVPSSESARLFKWVALLTGSKNTLKGVGFFLGSLLLTLLEFRGAIFAMAVALLLVWIFSLIKLRQDLGRSKNKPKFTTILSKNRSINTLSAARMFLFGSRDVWFVVALPVFLTSELGWPHTFVGGFLAVWIMLYGFVQSIAPRLVNRNHKRPVNGRNAFIWALLLAGIPLLIAAGMRVQWPLEETIIGGLILFGAIFAINSALHSYLIVQYASKEDVALDVGFYYMANATGRFFGTVLSGLLFQWYGLEICLMVSGLLLIIAALVSLGIDQKPRPAKLV